ncbi:MAG: hypothetical protein A2908_03050 [Candidatus Staskawiczbacteria bacterium RIFCSPLOWO2_01_FULL_38_12b]|uniref:Uncharacterized protein n=1 Tax=Candidatus Staskawiczbacteria bacterium RIFCSPLOWO2_01_FULL_38_12b TaxID=1802214 RepID=A0A1G2ICE0_9BACT|nr:MAG: hypothetical protein A2908_03050 [Candidatus Staskawiczbacteria bacterium RIFCSPLOWO2_01_FULL_38_12b]QBM02565.1 hypothetical protein [uncultured archaeon]
MAEKLRPDYLETNYNDSEIEESRERIVSLLKEKLGEVEASTTPQSFRMALRQLRTEINSFIED